MDGLKALSVSWTIRGYVLVSLLRHFTPVREDSLRRKHEGPFLLRPLSIHLHINPTSNLVLQIRAGNAKEEEMHHFIAHTRLTVYIFENRSALET